MFEAFATAERPQDLYLTVIQDPHFSPAGHAVAAAGIAEFIHNESRHLQASAVTTFWRAQEHMARREWGIAEQYLRQIIADGEPWGAPYIELGNLYGQRQRWREAAHFYRRGLELEPDSWLASDALGAALTEIQDWAGAIDAYRHALDVCPWWPYEEALYRLYARDGQKPKAQEIERRLQQLFSAPKSGRNLWWIEHMEYGDRFAR